MWIRLLSRRKKCSPERAAAQQAVADAQEAQREITEERRPLVQAVARRLRAARMENHWSERIEAAYAAARRGAAQ
ncbi:hypothetical protein GCM10018980_52110 [Streptomyces capoamus]|uniref:Uncharacterized protein n=1 Tax=Streptomyces capoamus TaxID=68183 RepID=A0A919F020_9ACTN|nr:hypothetical protein GCM10010501_28720 [Streptomyces libani subsp. rufus]GHG62278.1 hypothetical protein GCM10018980_52110 [Streptomyces capoamus]